MWPKWTERSLLLMTAGQSALAPAGHIVSELIKPITHGNHSFDSALSKIDTLLTEHLRGSSHKGFVLPRRKWTAWIDERWTRMACLTWPVQLSHQSQFEKYMHAEFERRFGLNAMDWRFVSPGAWPNRSSLCAAIQNSHYQAIESLAARHRIQISDVTPFPVAEINGALTTWPKAPFIFLGSAAQQQPVFLCHRGRVVDFALLPASEQVIELARSVFAQRSSLVPRWYVKVVYGRDESQAQLLGRSHPKLEKSPLPESTKANDSMKLRLDSKSASLSSREAA